MYYSVTDNGMMSHESKFKVIAAIYIITLLKGFENMTLNQLMSYRSYTRSPLSPSARTLDQIEGKHEKEKEAVDSPEGAYVMPKA
jgi:hypothetical protein